METSLVIKKRLVRERQRKRRRNLSQEALELERQAVVRLLRNLNPQGCLMNGTRLLIKNLNEHNYIHAKIIIGSKKGRETFIPRIDLTPSDKTLPFKLRRRQFPVIPGFAMTINKSQGQSFNHVGVYLPRPVSTTSRTTSRTTLCCIDMNTTKKQLENIY